MKDRCLVCRAEGWSSLWYGFRIFIFLKERRVKFMDESTLIRPGVGKHIFHIQESIFPWRFTSYLLLQISFCIIRFPFGWKPCMSYVIQCNYTQNNWLLFFCQFWLTTLDKRFAKITLKSYPFYLNVYSRNSKILKFKFLTLYTGLFKINVGVLTTCHTQYTWDSSM
jgi:hypothetical protein